MTDDLKKRLGAYGQLGTRGSDHPHSIVCRDALARITDLEAKLQRIGRELNLAKYGEPDFAWEIHKNAVADLEARLAAAEAGEDALAEILRPLADENPLPTCNCLGCRVAAALAAYEARRKGG